MFSSFFTFFTPPILQKLTLSFRGEKKGRVQENKKLEPLPLSWWLFHCTMRSVMVLCTNLSRLSWAQNWILGWYSVIQLNADGNGSRKVFCRCV